MKLCNYPCPNKTRYYEIEAIQIPIVYNRFGDHDPNGLLYVLKKDASRIRKGAIQNFEQEIPQPYEEVMPLVIRANVGFNKDTTTRHQIIYTWYATKEGVYFFHDMGDSTGNEDGTNIHGLFGAIIVEAAESKWLNPQTGEELEIKNKDGEQPIDPHTGLPSATTAISYRSEPMRNRMPLTHDHADTGEDISMSSWVYGAPATPVFKAYAGERVIFRTLMPADKPRNVGFCIHGHMWKQQPDNALSRIIPLQGAISIGNTFNMELENGASSPGDYLYRSGSFKWDVESGMWGIFRVLKQGIHCKCTNLCKNICKKALSCVNKNCS